MANSVATQCILANSVTRVGGRTRLTQILPSSNNVPCMKRNVGLRVRCMADDEGQKQESARAPKVSTKFNDVLAFSGPAPERINGRLAMIGFVAALAVELSNGQDVFAQIANGGVPWFVGTSVVLSFASLIPLFKGVSVQSKSDGFFTPDAEMWNGRFAMLGLVALAFTEYVKGGALV